jgi:mRNA interferase RelE/StbE
LKSGSDGWTVLFEPAARKQMRDLPTDVRQRILDFLEGRLLRSPNPWMLGLKLEGARRNLWRFRVGEYRLIAERKKDRLVILVVKVAHRREVYR